MISFSTSILQKIPQFEAATMTCTLVNGETSASLWEEIQQYTAQLRHSLTMQQINQREEIAATRKAYKILGKDPNRYRPSAEALHRRIIKGEELYRINCVVDCINLLSLQSGYSIGGFDAEQIKGSLELTIGRKEDNFEAIGRGSLNIENLPSYRDQKGVIGTPTSDCTRTRLVTHTTHLLMIVNSYSGNRESLKAFMATAITLLQKYAQAKNIKIDYYNKNELSQDSLYLQTKQKIEMNKETIGMNAGLIWNTLCNGEKLTLKAIKKATKLKDKEVFTAIGWLMREDKIAVEEIEGDYAVTLI